MALVHDRSIWVNSYRKTTDLKEQMHEEVQNHDDGTSEELLRRALLDDSSSVAVSLRVDGLPLSEAVTVIFHAR